MMLIMMTVMMHLTLLMLMMFVYISVCRLRYLLQQSDLFAHFGVRGDHKLDAPLPAHKDEVDKVTGTHRRSYSPTNENEMDADEAALAEEEVKEETVLTAQPSCITGGLMR